MTRPKFRPCTHCQTPNQANRKICFVCHQSLSTKKIKEKVQTFDDQWRETVIKNRNVSRIMDSAQIAVRKLHALGFKPILLFAREEKSSSTSVPVQPHTSTGQVFSPKEQFTGEKAEDLIDDPKETTAEEQPKITPQNQEETVIMLDRVPVSPPVVPSSPVFQKKKRVRSSSPAASPPTLPSVSPIDQPCQQSYESPAANPTLFSRGGLFENKKRKRKFCFH
ncbi:uncharacterized protein LOC103132897 isoform X2 [Poecilia formosa]|uniref:uncharacterized protein LOC103132897 isoform X2 n=1 Tax=Poecilia formosa TaxID=48698 RepID=UPI0007B953F2|nr:PREDICTED: uncharacterized protein LOC103132897 isoform X2 [Poecilia formosa]